jgi:hypothetical protein
VASVATESDQEPTCRSETLLVAQEPLAMSVLSAQTRGEVMGYSPTWVVLVEAPADGTPSASSIK